ncbi:MAG: STAS domain-containing protein [Betaproteobacteria bacterium]
MELASHRYGDVVVAAPVGRIDHANADSLTAALAPLLDPADGAGLLLDFSRVDYISSVGLRVLMLAAKTLRTQQRKLGVAAPTTTVREIFEISRFNLILDLSPTVRDGLARLSPHAVATFDVARPAGAA